MQRFPYNHYVFLLETAWNNSKEREKDNSVSELTTNGEFALNGREMTPLTSKLQIRVACKKSNSQYTASGDRRTANDFK